MLQQAVYLLHFDQRINPDRPAQHYIGWTLDLSRRIRQHRRGKAARLTAVAKERRIGFSVAQVWPGGTPQLERKLKNRKNAPKFCPVCARLAREEASPEVEFMT